MNFLQRWIQKNSEKSELEKKNIALFYSFVFTSLILIVWIFNTINIFRTENSFDIQSQVASPTGTMISNFKAIFENNKK